MASTTSNQRRKMHVINKKTHVRTSLFNYLSIYITIVKLKHFEKGIRVIKVSSGIKCDQWDQKCVAHTDLLTLERAYARLTVQCTLGNYFDSPPYVLLVGEHRRPVFSFFDLRARGFVSLGPRAVLKTSKNGGKITHASLLLPLETSF